MKLRNWIADWLCRIACWLRGHKWYVGDNMASAPGNRIAELRQSLWESYVIAWDKEDQESLDLVDEQLTELAQAAGEAWGHIWPKEKP